MRKIKVFIGFILVVLLVGCATGRGMVSDLGDGVAEYRAIQEDIRSGETELAITGTKLENESRELRSEISQIGDGIRELESAISAGQGEGELIDAIFQQIRDRPLDPAFIEGWRNCRVKEGFEG